MNKHVQTMFRNFYAEQSMTDPRDSWYKPNLLYNIHYRPPTTPTPPKMTVVTRKFNPSVCSCGEHGCGPHYRMEREIIFYDKNIRKEGESGEITGEVQDQRDVSTKTGYVDSSAEDGESDNDGDDDDDYDDDDDDELVERKHDTTKSIQNSNGVVMKENSLDSVSRFDDLAEPETHGIDVPDINEPSVNVDEDDGECGSAFGIMRIYCDSELHTSWNEHNKFHGNRLRPF